MNQRTGSPRTGGTAAVPDSASCVPLMQGAGSEMQGTNGHAAALPGRSPVRAAPPRKDPAFSRDAVVTVWRDHAFHVISGNYFYKTESYYSILRHEMEGKAVRPSSAAVIDAYVVPVCLERARLAKIPVCNWGISQGYAPLPSILYGLNYYATAADYTVVRDGEKAKEVIKHITNKGKYPFCYQKLEEGATIGSCISIFGKTTGDCRIVSDIAEKVYDLFSIPLVTIVYVRYGDRCLLSSISSVKYSHMSEAERSVLSAYLTQQEFL